MAQASPASPAPPAASPGPKSAKAFFTHKLEPIPAVDPPYFTALFDQHVAGLTHNECNVVLKEFVDICRECYQDHLGRPANHFSQNDGMQALLDMPLSHFGASEGWERRKNLVRSFTTTFFQRSVTCAAANIRHALVQSAGGFERRGHTGGTYVSITDGLMFHNWRSMAEARRFIATCKKLWQTIFELQLKTIRCPVSSVYLYRGLIFTITAIVPLLPEGDAAPDLDCGALLQHELDVLRHAMHIPHSTTDFGVQRGGDGRYYILDLDALMPLKLEVPVIDASTIVRVEAYDHLPPMVFTAEPVAVKSALLTTITPMAVTAVLEHVRSRDATLATCVKDQVSSKALHSVGLNLRFMFIVYEEIFDQEASPTLGYEPKELNTALESMELEMVCRTVKEMIRCELRFAPGEDDQAHCQRVNRLMNTLVNKKSGLWETQMMPLLRQKFTAPENFKINLTSGTVKVLASYISSKLGVAFDKANFRFNGFVGVPITTCMFVPPPELLKTVAAQSNANANNSSGSASPDLQRSQSQARLNSPELQRSTSLAGSGQLVSNDSFASGGPKSPTNDSQVFSPPNSAPIPSALQRKDTMALVQAHSNEAADDAKREISEKMCSAWDEHMAAEKHFALDNKDSYMTTSNNGLMVKFYRILTLERMMQLPTFEKHRSELLNFKFSAYPLHDIVNESHKHPPVPDDRLEQAAVQVKIMGLVDKVKTLDRDKFLVLLEILTNDNRNHEDAIIIGKYLAYLGKQQTGESDLLIQSTKHMKHATWLDIGLVNEFFFSSITAANALNISKNTMQLKDMLKNIVRVHARCNAKVRRPQAVSVLRKVSAALVSSQDVDACEALKVLTKDSYNIHCDRFGPTDTQSGVAHAHCVFVYATANRAKLAGSHDKELKKFHHYVSTMGTSTMEALKQLLASEAYSNNLSSVILALQSAGEVTLAEKAMTHLVGAGGANTTMLNKTVGVLQEGASNRLGRMFRSFVSQSKDREIRKLIFMDHAYRVGVDYEVFLAWQVVERAEIESLHRAARREAIREEKNEREKLVDLIWRNRYEARREERVRDKEEEIMRQKEAKKREAQEAAEKLAMKKKGEEAVRKQKEEEEEKRRQREEDRRRKEEEERLAKEVAESEAAKQRQREAAEKAEQERLAQEERLKKEEEAQKLMELFERQREQFFKEEEAFREKLATEEEETKNDLVSVELQKRQTIIRQLHARIIMQQEAEKGHNDIVAEDDQFFTQLRELMDLNIEELLAREKLQRLEDNYFQQLQGCSTEEALGNIEKQEAERREEIVEEEITIKQVKIKTFEEEREELVRRLHQRIALDVEESKARAKIIDERNFELAFLRTSHEIQWDEIITRIKFYELQFALYKMLMKQFKDELEALQKALRQLLLDERKRRKEIEEEERAARNKLFMWFLNERTKIETADILRKKNREMREAHRLAMLKEREKRMQMMKQKRQNAREMVDERNAAEMLIMVQKEKDLKDKALKHDNVFIKEQQHTDAKVETAESRRQAAREERELTVNEIKNIKAQKEKELKAKQEANAAAVAERKAQREAARQKEKEDAEERKKAIATAAAKPLTRVPLYNASPNPDGRSSRNERLAKMQEEKESRISRKQKAIEDAQLRAGRKKDLLAACLFLMQRDDEALHVDQAEKRDEERAVGAAKMDAFKQEMEKRNLEFVEEHRALMKLERDSRLGGAEEEELRTKHRDMRELKSEVRRMEQSKRLADAQLRVQRKTLDNTFRKLEDAKREAAEWEVKQSQRRERILFAKQKNSDDLFFNDQLFIEKEEQQFDHDANIMGRLHNGLDLVDALKGEITELHDTNPDYCPSNPNRAELSAARKKRLSPLGSPTSAPPRTTSMKDEEPPALPPINTAATADH